MNFAYAKFTHVKHRIIFFCGSTTPFLLDKTLNGLNYICKIFRYVRMYEGSRHETKRFVV